MRLSFALPTTAVLVLMGACTKSEGQSSETSADAGVDGKYSRLSIEDGCAIEAAGYCDFAKRCRTIEFTTSYADEAECVALRTQTCIRNDHAPDSNRNGDDSEQCGTAYKARTTCWGPTAICDRVPGNRPAGASCQYDASCASGVCSIHGGRGCGTCIQYATSGEPCASHDGCDPENDLACTGITQTCGPVPHSNGGGCSSGYVLGECGTGLNCVHVDPNDPGKCQVPVSGDKCFPGSGDDFCKSATTGLVCGVPQQPPGPVRYGCVPVTYVALGTPCTVAANPSNQGSYSADAICFGGAWTKRIPEGAACTQQLCAGNGLDLECASGTCVPMVDRGCQ